MSTSGSGYRWYEVSRQVTTMHQRFPANNTGRDFIVGDMHGCLDLFELELAKVSFDPSCDRVFSVGDLVDRGADSMGCLRLLKQPWFHAVMGNHEHMLLNFASAGLRASPVANSNDVFLTNGGDWVQKINDAEKAELWEDLVPRVAQLPLLMSVGQGSNQFHVVHAELMSGEPELSERFFAAQAARAKQEPSRILTDDDLKADTDKTLSSMADAMLWGRRVFKTSNPKGARTVDLPMGRLLVSRQPWHPGLSLVYAGHTRARQMRLHASHLFIDRGAFQRSKDSCLLMVCHQEISEWLAAA